MTDTWEKSLAKIFVFIVMFAVTSTILAEDFFHYELGDNQVSISGYYGTEVDIVIPSSIEGHPVTAIGEGAFAGQNITSAQLPDSLLSIGDYAFSSCEKLTSVEFPDSVLSIGAWAFLYCSELRSVLFGASVAIVGSGAFGECSKLTEISVSPANAWLSVDDGVLFNKEQSTLLMCFATKAGHYQIPAGVSSIADYAFYRCRDLSWVDIPDSVIRIGDYAFFECSGLGSLLLPDSVESIGEAAWLSCSGLISLQIGAGLSQLGEAAFAGCLALEEITVSPENLHFSSDGAVLHTKDRTVLLLCPAGKAGHYQVADGVTSIGDGAFAECINLTSVHIPDGVVSIGAAAFSDCYDLSELRLPDGLSSIADWAFFACRSLGSVTIPASVSSIGSYAFSSCHSLLAVQLPSGLSSISDSAFSSCESLTSVLIPVGVSSIGAMAFAHCENLTSVQLPEALINIGDGAFYHCYKLPELLIPSSVTSIGNYAFSDNSSLGAMVIPDSVLSIGEDAFNACSSLTSLTIGAGLSSIGYYAFYGCTSLADISVAAANTRFSAADGILFNKEQTSLIQCLPGKTGHCQIPDGVIRIQEVSFYGCNDITSVGIPESVTSIGESAFYGCEGLAGIYFAATPPELDGQSQFNRVAGTAYYVSGTPGWEDSYGGLPTALWRCQAIFEADGGSASFTERSYDAGQPYGELPGAERDDANFAGWWTEAEGGLQVSADSLLPLRIDEHRLHARWATTAVHALSFDLGEQGTYAGGAALTQLVEEGGAAVAPFFTVENGWEFTGWEQDFSQVSESRAVRALYRLLYDFQILDDQAIIAGYTGSATDIIIPSSINGYPVSRIAADAFIGCDELTSVVIPAGVVSIGEQAFFTCVSLSSVQIPDSVVHIGKWAFFYCESLTSVELPPALSSIEQETFFACKALTSVVIPDGVASIGLRAFYGCEGLSSVEIPASVTFIDEWAFGECSALLSVVIPDSVSSLGEATFYGCSGLDSVVLSAGLSSIQANTFAGCSSLASVEIPAGVSSIEEWAFYACSSLTNVLIPDSVTSIGEGVFCSCSGLLSVEIGAGLANLGKDVFDSCPALTDIEVAAANAHFSSLAGVLFNKEQTELLQCPAGRTGAYQIPDSVSSIGYAAFYTCVDLTKVEIPASVTSIGDWAFGDCFSLSSVLIPDSVSSIGEAAFYACDGLANIVLGSGLLSIGDSAFAECSGLSNVEIPDRVSNLGDWAFFACGGLTDVVIPDSVASIGEGAFCSCSGLLKVEIGTGLANLGKDVFDSCPALTDIEVAAANAHFSSIDGVLFNKDQTELLQCPAGKTGAYQIPDSVLSIGYAAFYTCASLTRVEIPASVTSLGDWAFGDCFGLSSVVIPDSVSSLGEAAFYACSELASIVLGGGLAGIGDRAFADCKNLTSIYFAAAPPEMGADVFEEVTATIYYLAGTAGWEDTFEGLATAVWRRQALFDANGGSASFTERSYDAGLPYGELPRAERDGVSFAGWWTAPEGGLQVSADSLLPLLTGELTLYARWATASVYTVSFDLDEYGVYAGGAALTQLVAEGDAALAPLFTVRSGWEFTGWELDFSEVGESLVVRALYRLLYDFQILDDQAIVTGYTGSETDIIIPSSINGYPVSRIADWAFAAQFDLLTVVIPDSVVNIGEGAFGSCYDLISLQIGAGVSSMGVNVFQSCESLMDINVSAANACFSSVGGVLFDKEQRLLLHYPAARAGAYQLPDTVIDIGDKAFHNCRYLSGVVIPDSVIVIGERAFYSCPRLDSLQIGAGVSSIGIYAFYGCKSLKEISVSAANAHFSSLEGVLFNKEQTFLLQYPIGKAGAYQIPGTVNSIEHSSFMGSAGLTELDIPDTVSSIGDWAFAECASLASVLLPDSLGSIGDGLFAYCHGLSSIQLGSGLSSIGYRAFYDCSALTSVMIPDTVTQLGNGVFERCSSLRSAVIGDAVTSIGQYAFAYCSSLESIRIGSSVGSIGFCAFTDCYSLGSVDIPDSVSSIGAWVFDMCSSLVSVQIGAGLSSMGDDIFDGCDALVAIHVSPANAYYSSLDGVLFNKEQTELLQCPAGKTGHYQIPSTVLSINSGAFVSCNKLSGVDIPASVSSIKSWAFGRCGSLTSLVIPDSVSSIGDYAFYLCKNLASIVIGAGVDGIGYAAFAECSRLGDIYCAGAPPSMDDHRPFQGISATVYYLAGTPGWGESFKGLPTAVWSCLVSFDGSGGTASFTERSYEAGQPYGELPMAEADDFFFAGWWTEPDGGSQVSADSRVALLTDGFTLYARWTASIELHVGWNMICATLELSQESEELLLDQGLMMMQAAGKSYELATSVMPGKACWLFSTKDCTLTLSGGIAKDDDLQLKPGWNFIGAVVDTAIPLNETVAWEWTAGGYRQAEADENGYQLKAGRGYWLHSH
jgi:hypothetical protein